MQLPAIISATAATPVLNQVSDPRFFQEFVFFVFQGWFFLQKCSGKSDPAAPEKTGKRPPPLPDFSAASLDLFPESPDHLAPCEPVGAHFFHLGFFDEFFRHLAGATVSRPG